MAEGEIKLDIDGLRKRDEAALRGLFDFLLPALRNRAEWDVRRIGGHAVDAEDLAHQAILKIYENLDRFLGDDTGASDEERQKRLLMISIRVMRNLALDHARRYSRRLGNECRNFDLESLYSTEDKFGLGQPELLETFKELLDTLSDRDRQLLTARLAGQTMAEIAQSQGLTMSTVYRQYQRIMSHLREQLKKSGY